MTRRRFWPRHEGLLAPSRRSVVAGLAASVALSGQLLSAAAADAVTFGLNPLFLDSDIQLLSMMQTYLAQQLGRPVQLVKRRTYQEITAMLLTGQLDAAWVCDDPRTKPALIQAALEQVVQPYQLDLGVAWTLLLLTSRG